jgi:hypothetical protein
MNWNGWADFNGSVTKIGALRYGSVSVPLRRILVLTGHMPMTSTSATLSDSETMTKPARAGRLLERIYRDIGLAAVAHELDLSADDLEPKLSEAVKRGARYIYLMPKPIAV